MGSKKELADYPALQYVAFNLYYKHHCSTNDYW